MKSLKPGWRNDSHDDVQNNEINLYNEQFTHFLI